MKKIEELEKTIQAEKDKNKYWQLRMAGQLLVFFVRCIASLSRRASKWQVGKLLRVCLASFLITDIFMPYFNLPTVHVAEAAVTFGYPCFKSLVAAHSKNRELKRVWFCYWLVFAAVFNYWPSPAGQIHPPLLLSATRTLALLVVMVPKLSLMKLFSKALFWRAKDPQAPKPKQLRGKN